MSNPLDKDKSIEQLAERINLLADELHAQAKIVQSPQSRALLETSAEVMEGMGKAFDHFLNKTEDAWDS